MTDVAKFLDRAAKGERRHDCQAVLDIMREVTGEDPVMWGKTVVGFGRYHYKYETGREGDWMLTGFSPRKNDLTLYVLPNLDAWPDLVQRLGKVKTGRSCLYIKRLADIDTKVLKLLIKKSVAALKPQRVR